MSAAVPIRETDRYQSLDMIRGVALFGILLMNITGFGLPFAYGDPTNYGGAAGVIGEVGQPRGESGGESRANPIHRPASADSVCAEVFVLSR